MSGNMLFSCSLGPKCRAEAKRYGNGDVAIWIYDGPIHATITLSREAAERLYDAAWAAVHAHDELDSSPDLSLSDSAGGTA